MGLFPHMDLDMILNALYTLLSDCFVTLSPSDAIRLSTNSESECCRHIGWKKQQHNNVVILGINYTNLDFSLTRVTNQTSTGASFIKPLTLKGYIGTKGEN